LTNYCGPYPLEFEANQVGLGPLDLSDLHRRLIKGAAAKATAVRWLMAQAPWDLFMVVWGETHPAAHYFWSPDSSLPTSGPSRLRDIYVAIDSAIGEILKELNDDVTVFVVSGDGVGPNCAGWHLLPKVLQQLGFAVTRDGGRAEEAAGRQQSRGKGDLLKRMRNLVPADLRQALSRRLPARCRDYLMSRWATADLDWSRTRAFCLPTDLEGCIRINLKGREPGGIVEQGAEYERIRKDLATSLQQLINPLTGRPAVRQVIATDEIFPGDRRHYLPDLIVLWADDGAIEAVHSPELGQVQAPSPDARTGTHRPPGFVIGRGPRVPRDRVLEGGHVIDFAPTVLAKFSLPPRPHMDGRAWTAMEAD